MNIAYENLDSAEKKKILYGVDDVFEIGHVSKFDTGGSTHRAKYE